MKKNILFVDPIADKPYHIELLEETNLGKSETAILNVARNLTSKYHVYIAQKARENIFRDKYGPVYLPYLLNETYPFWPRFDAIIVLNNHKILKKLRQNYPDSPIYLWYQTIPGKSAKNIGDIIQKNHIQGIITDSCFNKQEIENFICKYQSRACSIAVHVLPCPQPDQNQLEVWMEFLEQISSLKLTHLQNDQAIQKSLEWENEEILSFIAK